MGVTAQSAVLDLHAPPGAQGTRRWGRWGGAERWTDQIETDEIFQSINRPSTTGRLTRAARRSRKKKKTGTEIKFPRGVRKIQFSPASDGFDPGAGI